MIAHDAGETGEVTADYVFHQRVFLFESQIGAHKALGAGALKECFDGGAFFVGVEGVVSYGW